MKRFELALLCGLVLAIIASSFTAFASECGEVREQVVRLHVLANSDDSGDQELKLAVRDAVLKGTEGIFTEARNKEQVEQTVQASLLQIEEIARREIRAQGYDYPVQAQLVNMYFETRVYEQATLPAGYYDAVRITIGQGDGQNWWCVMFPPMCIPAATGDGGMELEEQILQLGKQPQYEPKFAVVEAVESLWGMVSGKSETTVEA